jgi:hypothetical protein
MSTNIDTDLNKLKQECDRLNAEEKASLLKHLLGGAGINVTIGSSQFTADTLYQINLALSNQLAGILNAIADKISSKKDS